MIDNSNFLRSILNSVTEHIVVIDHQGDIRFVNQAWVTFGEQNSCKISGDQWQTINYLNVCDASGRRGEAFGKSAAKGIRHVIDNGSSQFRTEYPCHSRTEKRWFVMTVTPLNLDGLPYFAISHQNVTERKLAEDHVRNLSRIDGLTNVPNRRTFDEFLADEWKRCSRLGIPISVAILDIDSFKLLNDHYGHPSGDDCLVKIGQVLNSVKKRPGDLFARYGGEEFGFIFGNSTSKQAMVPLNKIVENIRALEIPNVMSPTKPIVTASIGLATVIPDKNQTAAELLKVADLNLYSAKHNGKDRIVC